MKHRGLSLLFLSIGIASLSAIGFAAYFFTPESAPVSLPVVKAGNIDITNLSESAPYLVPDSSSLEASIQKRSENDSVYSLSIQMTFNPGEFRSTSNNHYTNGYSYFLIFELNFDSTISSAVLANAESMVFSDIVNANPESIVPAETATSGRSYFASFPYRSSNLFALNDFLNFYQQAGGSANTQEFTIQYRFQLPIESSDTSTLLSLSVVSLQIRVVYDNTGGNGLK